MKVAAGSILWLAMVPTALLAQSRPSDVPRQIYGKVQVVDATTFEFVKSRQIVRLAGYEAPRLEQTATSDGVEWPAGQVSRAWMILRTLGQNVNCAPVDRDTNKVLIAHCFVGETNLAATAIAEGIGYAFNYRNEPQVAAYFDIERKARGLGYGVWSSPDLLPPWLYTASTVAAEKSDGQSPEAETVLPLPLPVTQTAR
ncbi:nuclease (plasmid) [Rhizobium leguminosarum bv. trifolii WSM1689]|uniref:Endonuclease YncB(Thermonuclease family) n=2 Tax=Rhizobium laguerreae TaxID=1076926 RepID=A0AAX2QCT8_9HYPH|nr:MULTISPECIES: thermonuclease family protein [Rhizobium]AHF88319.1 nuclease [Rhizobium leguminosarum bv. trifolii WSM1689]MBY3185572.1 nuclease [Rhizobium laguerreae]NKM29717.1 nuclease [Rhizobium laguerreae]NKM96073.1 nuclease [Rhizobium leguminosarum bv. viciae]TCU15530.1 endonuclease YncB(thermonuclease family) [Rhizobium laguerreae]